MESLSAVADSTPDGSVETADSPDDLWPAAARGDRGAAERLAAATYRGVFASLCKLSGDPELASDLAQETYRKAWAALERFRGGCAFSSWLYRIAFTTFLNHVRRPSRVVPLDERRARQVPAPATPADERLDQRREEARLRRAVLGLPEPLALTVTARYWGEMPVREIARLQEISTVAVRKRLKKALALLAETLEETR